MDMANRSTHIRQLPDQLVRCMGWGGNDAVGTEVTGGVCDGGGNGFGVDIQANVSDL